MEIYDKNVTEQSRRDMEKFLHFANSIGEVPLLFGGWAVHQFNPYAGSKDVDFAVSDKNFDKCVDYLVKKEGYTLKAGRLIKGDIFFDLYKRSDDLSGLKLDILYDSADLCYLRGTRHEIMLPSIDKLFYSKCQALAGRKVPKDASDAIALLLKFDEEHFKISIMLSPRVKERLMEISKDADALGCVTKPTKRNMNELKKRIKKLLE